jgi:hypothetical protein
MSVRLKKVETLSNSDCAYVGLAESNGRLSRMSNGEIVPNLSQRFVGDDHLSIGGLQVISRHDSEQCCLHLTAKNFVTPPEGVRKSYA